MQTLMTDKHKLIVAAFSLGLMLTSCSTTSNTSEQTAARMKMLAEQSETAPRGNQPIYPAGKKPLRGLDMVESVAKSCQDNDFALYELSTKNVGLSNQDVTTAVNLLDAIGFNTLVRENSGAGGDGSGFQRRFACDELPIIITPTPKEEDDLTYYGSSPEPADNISIEPLRNATAVDLDQLIVFYHETQKAQLDRLEKLIREVIDVASPQVYIETLVLDVSEEDSKELGVAYETANIGNSLLSIGSLDAESSDPSVDFERNTRRDADGNAQFSPGTGVQAQIRALVSSGNAEVLARPSILALSNRQAVIQIVDVLPTPIVESSIGTTGELVVSSYSFESLKLGITLNMRPRASFDRQWVSLEIDATVESEIDENSGAVFAPDGSGGSIQLAEKKGSGSKKVKTSARIPDRTPIVIGGLVSGKRERQKSRVPLVGQIPGIGALFGATDNEEQKREIVIVITPHILAEDAVSVRANMADRSVMDRQSDLDLFSNLYRVTQNDVFDMNFLMADQRYMSYRQKALQYLQDAPELSGHPVLRIFEQNRIPGDEALTRKMVFDIVSSNLHQPLPDLTQLYIPVWAGADQHELQPMSEVVQPLLKKDQFRKPVVLQLMRSADGDHSFAIVDEPVARQNLGSEDFIVLRDPSDLERLSLAIITEMTIESNGGYDELNIATVKDGMMLKIANGRDHRGYRVSGETAKVYRDSKYTLTTVRDQLESAYQQIDSIERPL